jgi:hypothetical protein
VRPKHSRLRLALIAALPLEVINFWVIGYPAATHPISHLSHDPAIALQWYLFHLPGIITLDRSAYLREQPAIDSVVLFLAGYISTAIFFITVFWLAGLARRTLRKLSSPLKRVA